MYFHVLGRISSELILKRGILHQRKTHMQFSSMLTSFSAERAVPMRIPASRTRGGWLLHRLITLTGEKWHLGVVLMSIFLIRRKFRHFPHVLEGYFYISLVCLRLSPHYSTRKFLL